MIGIQLYLETRYQELQQREVTRIKYYKKQNYENLQKTIRGEIPHREDLKGQQQPIF